MSSAAAVRAAGPPPSGCAESSIALRDGPRSSARLGSACNPTSDSPPPSARPSAGSRGGRCAGRLAVRTSISAPSAADAIAAACPASRSWRSPEGPPGPPGTHGRPAGGDRRQSGAAAGSQAGAAGAGFPRSGRRSPPAPGDPARTGQHAQHHLQRRGVEHGVELISPARLTDVGRVVEHYGQEKGNLPDSSNVLPRLTVSSLRRWNFGAIAGQSVTILSVRAYRQRRGTLRSVSVRGTADHRLNFWMGPEAYQGR